MTSKFWAHWLKVGGVIWICSSGINQYMIFLAFDPTNRTERPPLTQKFAASFRSEIIENREITTFAVKFHPNYKLSYEQS